MARLSGGFAAYADTHAAASTARAWSTWNPRCARLTQLGALAGNPMDGVPRAKVPRPGPHAFTDIDMATLLDTVRDDRDWEAEMACHVVDVEVRTPVRHCAA